MEEISSQNSDLGLEDLDKLEAKGQAENTKRATSFPEHAGDGIIPIVLKKEFDKTPVSLYWNSRDFVSKEVRNGKL